MPRDTLSVKLLVIELDAPTSLFYLLILSVCSRVRVSTASYANVSTTSEYGCTNERM